MPPRVTCTPASPPAIRRVAALIRRTGATTLMIVWIDTQSSSTKRPALTQRRAVACAGLPNETEVRLVVRPLTGLLALPGAGAEPMCTGTASSG